MSHQVIWTARVVELFETAANLNDLEKQILESRVHGMTIRQQALFYNLSESTVSRIVARLKRKYDEVQKEFPDDLKPRRKSAAETYLDEN